ncbi:MAG: hypothetical protein ACOZAA_11555 [Pseudomonadota bacterium]
MQRPLRISAAILTAVLTGCAAKVEGEALYDAGKCRRVTIVDAENGAAVVGAEDLAFDRVSRRILISAYDRRKVEREVKSAAFDIAQGGVYSAPIASLAGDETTLTLASIIARDSVGGGLRPHGLSFDPGRREIAFINRSYQRIDDKWRMTARLERADADGAVFVGEGRAPRCSANDVATLGETTLVSFDHASCGWRGGVEDIFASRASGVATADGERVFDGVRHANGVAALSSGELALAATRDREILVLTTEGEGLSVERKFPLPGAPDNLTVSSNGDIVAALHPSLLAIGMQRRLGLGRSGSRIVRVDPETGETTLLFEDRRAKLFSAATAAVEEEGLLAIGSVADSGLVVCKRSNEAP